jgi:hypothetical protein
MINHPYKVGHVAAEIKLKKRQEKALARKEFVLTMFLLLLLAATGDMIYLDCVERGVC